MATPSFKGTYQRLPGCNNTHGDEIIAQCQGPSSTLTFPPHFDISFSPAATTLHTSPSHPHLLTLTFPLYSNVCSWESRNKQILEHLSHHLSSCVIFITWHIHKLLHRCSNGHNHSCVGSSPPATTMASGETGFRGKPLFMWEGLHSNPPVLGGWRGGGRIIYTSQQVGCVTSIC